MGSLTGADVWAAALGEPAAEEMPEGSKVREVMRPLIEEAPVALAEFLDKPLTLQALADSKSAFLQHCMKRGFAEKMSEAIGMGGTLVTAMIEGAVEVIAAMMRDVPAFLLAQGTTEEQLMLHEKVGLSDANKALYKAGTLTIEGVLRTQPSVIFKMDCPHVPAPAAPPARRAALSFCQLFRQKFVGEVHHHRALGERAESAPTGERVAVHCPIIDRRYCRLRVPVLLGASRACRMWRMRLSDTQ